MKRNGLNLAELTLFGMLAALTFALKVAMAWLPNVEPVSLMVMVMGAVFGYKALFPVYTYALLEILVYGIGTWNINYLYIWAILAVVSVLLRSMRSGLGWAILSGFFGLAFGALCAPVDVFIGGFGYAFSKWTLGIGFDLAHCAGNFVIALLLFVPLRDLTERLYAHIKK